MWKPETYIGKMWFAQVRLGLVTLLTTLLLSACALPPEGLLIPTPTLDASQAPEASPDQRRDQRMRQVQAEAEDGVHPDLARALNFAPLNSTIVEYTNWALLKNIAGAPQLTSASPMEERIAFMIGATATEQAAASAFGNPYFTTHAETWGWDATDLVWEATVGGPGAPPTYVLRFRDDFDFAPVVDYFLERDFAQADFDGVRVYSHPMDISAAWLRSSEFAILNTALLRDEQTLVLSSSPEAVEAILAARVSGATLDVRPDIRAVAATLGPAGAAIIQPLGCGTFDLTARLDDWSSLDQLRAAIDELRNTDLTGLYTVWGLGYRIQTHENEEIPVGVIAHFYPLAAQAHADLPARRALAETGMSLVQRDRPYADMFEVIEAEVIAATGNEAEAAPGNGASLVLTLRANERPPLLFFNMFYQRDMVFSICGG